LPSLLSERIWIADPEVPPQATPDVMDAPEVVEVPEAVVETGLAASDNIASARDLLPAEPQKETNRSKPVRHRAKSPDDLPRSQRWKRRLPRAVW
jgi:hypothetical protein